MGYEVTTLFLHLGSANRSEKKRGLMDQLRNAKRTLTGQEKSQVRSLVFHILHDSPSTPRKSLPNILGGVFLEETGGR